MCINCPYIVDDNVVKEGLCEECLQKTKRIPSKSNKKKSTKHSRRVKYKKHLKKIYKEKNAYSVCLRSHDKTDDSKDFYVKKSYGRSSYVRTYKHYSNKKIRMYNKSYIPKGQWCKKIFDFWWAID